MFQCEIDIAPHRELHLDDLEKDDLDVVQVKTPQ
jgi:hypothetical protein